MRDVLTALEMAQMRHHGADMRLFVEASERFGRRLTAMIRENRSETVSRLTDKLNRVADATGALNSEIEARADKFLQRRDDIRNKTDKAFAPHERLLDEADKGLDVVDAALGQLSNDSSER